GVRLVGGQCEGARGQRAYRLHDRKDDQQQDDERRPDLDPPQDGAHRGLRRRRGVGQFGEQVQRRLGRQRLLGGALGADPGQRGGRLGGAESRLRLRRPRLVQRLQRDELAGALGVGGLGLILGGSGLVGLARGLGGGLGGGLGATQLEHGR